MITAHLPSGYVAARLGKVRQSAPFWAVIIGAVLPDFDLIWFYFVDDRAFHHHHYWVHIPGVWLVITALTLPLIRVLRPRWMPVALAFLAGIALHILLDTIAGSIAWGWPFTAQLFELVTVQPTHSHFILSFMAHWTFALEIAIWASAAILFWRARRAGALAARG